MASPTLLDTRQATVAAVVRLFAPGAGATNLLTWPPDVFAIVAYLLQKSGAYIEVVRRWPPSTPAQDWAPMVKRVGNSWRHSCILGAPTPIEVRRWWSVIRAKSHVRVRDIAGDQPLVFALVELLAAADEACVGVGIPDSRDQTYDQFDNLTSRRLYQSHKQNASTLCKLVDPSLFRVLPKLHTPQSGITIRSLSHHLALCPAGEVNPKWVFHPPASLNAPSAGLNLLLVPWPERISLLDFAAAGNPPSLGNMPPNMGFFSFEQRSRDEWPSAEFRRLVSNAVEQVGRIDGVILPELALKSDAEFDQAYADLISVTNTAFLIAGVGGHPPSSTYDWNRLRYRIPLMSATSDISHLQNKHHRWRLDESQIRQYGLTHRLDPYTAWWENTELREREVHFFAMTPWLTLSALICEDLARQDPVADLLRAVGPNLIVALLMDGPQLQKRWSGRYATVFADDPGSSVLCLTSLGMALLSNPTDCADSPPPRRTIGLWKDSASSAREIELPEDADAVVVSLNRLYRQEWTADGRHDGGATAYLTFGRVHHVKK